MLNITSTGWNADYTTKSPSTGRQTLEETATWSNVRPNNTVSHENRHASHQTPAAAGDSIVREYWDQ